MRILAIDDEVQLLYLYRRILYRYNHEVITAVDGEEGVKIFLQEKKDKNNIDAILIDNRMENMDGIETTQKILVADKNAKIIFVSADLAVKQRALNMGAKCFIAKPFKFEKLVKEIERVVNEK